MKAFLTGTSAAILIAMGGAAIDGSGSPAFAAGAQNQPTQAQQSGSVGKASPHGKMTPTRVPVTSADDLLGRTLRDAQGNEAGEIKYVLIDNATGEVSYLMVGSGGLLDFGNENYAAVPWSAVEWSMVDRNPYARGSLRLNASFDTIKKAPQLSEDRLQEITSPSFATLVTSIYTPVPAQGGKQPGRSDQGGQQSSTSGGAGQSQQSSAQQSSSQSSTQQGASRAGQDSSQQQAASQSAQGGKGGQSGAQAGSKSAQDGQSFLMIGEQYVTTLLPPAFRQAREIEGAEVTAFDGGEVGEIDQVMIDTAHGQVAYVLVAQGGFLGIGENWVPVPFAALQWRSEDGGYRLTASEAQLKDVPALEQEVRPTRVSARDLSNLYQRFGVQPYWQSQVAETPQGGQARQGSQSQGNASQPSK